MADASKKPRMVVRLLMIGDSSVGAAAARLGRSDASRPENDSSARERAQRREEFEARRGAAAGAARTGPRARTGSRRTSADQRPSTGRRARLAELVFEKTPPRADWSAARRRRGDDLKTARSARIRGRSVAAAAPRFIKGRGRGGVAAVHQRTAAASPRSSSRSVADPASCAGKTSLVVRYDEDAFSTKYMTTIGVDYRDKFVELEGQAVKLQIWDTAGQERFRSLTANFFGKADGFVVCFDVGARATFDHVPDPRGRPTFETRRLAVFGADRGAAAGMQIFRGGRIAARPRGRDADNSEGDWTQVRTWIADIDRHKRGDVDVALCGCKCDLPDEKREVTRDEAAALASEFGAAYPPPSETRRDGGALGMSTRHPATGPRPILGISTRHPAAGPRPILGISTRHYSAAGPRPVHGTSTRHPAAGPRPVRGRPESHPRDGRPPKEKRRRPRGARACPGPGSSRSSPGRCR